MAKQKLNQLVVGIVAAALTLAVVVVGQLSGSNLSANISGRLVAVDPASCPAQGMWYDTATDSCMGGGGGMDGGNDPCPGDACPNVCCDSGSTGGSTYDPCPSDACPNVCCDSGSTGGSTYDPCPSDSCPNVCCGGSGTGMTCTAQGGDCCLAGSTTDPDCGSGTTIRCGDNVCSNSETVTSCPGDCGSGACSGTTPYRWANGSCNATQESGTTVRCGDNVCSNSETVTSCPSDCGGGTTVRCGDNVCSGSETMTTCPSDCRTGSGTTGTCGDWVCSNSETATSCPSDCGSGTGAACSEGQYWDFSTNSCKTSTTQMTQSICTQGGGVWKSTWCDFASAQTGTQTGGCQNPGGKSQAECTSSGCRWDSSGQACFYPETLPASTMSCGYNSTWDPATQRCVFQSRDMTTCTYRDPAEAGRVGDRNGCESKCGWYWDSNGMGGRGDCFPNQPMGGSGTATTTISYCEPPMYFDMFKQACVTPQMDTFYQEDFECPAWDKWCQQNKEGEDWGMRDENYENDWEKNFECMDARQASRDKADIQRQIKEIEYNFKTIDMSQASDSYVVMDTRTQLDKLKAIDLDDPCEIGKAWEFLKNFHGQGGMGDELRKAEEVAKFKRKISFLIQELQKEGSRITDETAVEYIQKGIEIATELKENPPYDPMDPGKMWQSMDPECYRTPKYFPMERAMGVEGAGMSVLPGPGRPGFGPGYGPKCSPEELIADGTPRGYLDAARQLDNMNRNKHYEENICEEAGGHISKFEEYVLPQLTGAYLTEGQELLARAKILLGKCATEKDKFKLMDKFDRLGRAVEDLMYRAGVDTSDFGFEDGEGFDIGGLNSYMGVDLQALIDQAVEKAVGKIMAKVEQMLTERLPDLIAKLGSLATEKFTAATQALTNEIGEDAAEDLATTVEYSLFVREEDAAAAEVQAETLSDVVSGLVEIQGANEEVADVVKEAITVVSENPLSNAMWAEIETVVDEAKIIVANGGEPEEISDKVQEVIELRNSYTDEEVINGLIEEGLWQYTDVTPGVDAEWYAAPVGEAWAKGVAEGTVREDGVGREFNPSKTLNVTEGTAMIFKAAGLNEATPTAEVKTLGVPEWGQGMVQAVADKVGMDKVREIFSEAGGAGGSMEREAFADMSIGVYESEVGTVSVNPSSQIGHYEDYGQMDDDMKHDFAVANEIGMITGANNGTSANFGGLANRAEAAKMLSALQDATENAEYEYGLQ